jgi:hypothetical protein
MDEIILSIRESFSGVIGKADWMDEDTRLALHNIEFIQGIFF